MSERFTNGEQWSAAISSEMPTTAFDAHVTAYRRETARIRRLLLCSPEPDAHIRAWHRSPDGARIVASFSTPEALLAAFERQWSEDADALAADQAARLDCEPTVVRPRLQPLKNDLYRLDEPRNDWMDETQRADAVEERKAANAEKLEDFSPAVKASQQSRKRRPEVEARRARLDALILAEEPAATAAARGKFPDSKRLQGVIDDEIAAALERKGESVGPKRIRQARKRR